MKTRRFRMRFLVCLLAIVLVAGLAGACAEPAPTPTTPAPATPAPATPAPATPAPATPAPETPEVIELIAHTPTPPVAPPGKIMDMFLDKFEEVSEGRVTFVRYYSSSLYEPREIIRSVQAGMADIHFSHVPQVEPGVMPLNCYLLLPFIGWSSTEEATAIHRELLASFPELMKEYQGMKVLFPTVYGNRSWVNTSTKLVQSRADMQGMKIQADSWGAKWVDLMGGTSVYVPYADRYTAFEKGIVEGTIGGFGPLGALGALELFTYHSYIPNGFNSAFDATIMNPEVWNSLPPDIQKIFDDLTPWYTEIRESVESETDDMHIEQQKEWGDTFVELSPEEAQLWAEVAKTLHEEWIEEVEGQGKPGRAFYEELQRLIAEHK